ncbi:hypothetical protein RHMOL_Rhmol08G0210200 [Rhododendron molle]|uniref:Uncharacterized protein n=1 Tax=Rhododendron molle TaxID=49168 RepID=A0ACC0MQU9_RHOML|nr:hypothetical protein RHMOL_Rhmol08G0210200 [Rhododendron molle]
MHEDSEPPIFVNDFEQTNLNAMEQKIAPVNFVGSIGLDFDDSSELRGSDELNLHCSPHVQPRFMDDFDSYSENSSEFGGNDELHSQCSPLESSPPLEFLPLCEAPQEKHLIAEEMEVDETNNWSPTCEEPALVIGMIDQVSSLCGIYPLEKKYSLLRKWTRR